MTAKQVKFKYEDEELGGILINNEYIICGCCGSVFELDDEEVEIIEIYENWVPLSDEIMGDY